MFSKDKLRSPKMKATNPYQTEKPEWILYKMTKYKYLRQRTKYSIIESGSKKVIKQDRLTKPIKKYKYNLWSSWMLFEEELTLFLFVSHISWALTCHQVFWWCLWLPEETLNEPNGVIHRNFTVVCKSTVLGS